MWVCRSQIVTIKSRVCSDLCRLRLEHQVPMSMEWKRRCNVTTRQASSISRRFTALYCRRLSIVCTLLWLGLITLVALGIRSTDQQISRFSQFHLSLRALCMNQSHSQSSVDSSDPEYISISVSLCLVFPTLYPHNSLSIFLSFCLFLYLCSSFICFFLPFFTNDRH